MYTAGVSCKGCHTNLHQVEQGWMSFTSMVSGAKQCSDCHNDESYGEMLHIWQEEVKERLAGATAELDELEKRCESADPSTPDGSKARAILAEARLQILCIKNDRSFGAHSYEYTTKILDVAEKRLAECASLTKNLPLKSPEDKTQ